MRHTPSGIFKYSVLVFVWIFFSLFTSIYAEESKAQFDFEYGEKLIQEGFYDLAVIHFRKFLHDYPTSPQCAKAQWHLAQALFQNQQYEEAKSEYLRYVLSYPTAPDLDLAQFRLGECFERTGKLISAMQAYRMVYMLYPQSPFAWNGLLMQATIAFGLDSLELAESTLQLLLANHPPSPIRAKAAILLSDVYEKSQQEEKSISLLSSIASGSFQGEEVKALLKLGKIHEKLGDWEKSKEHYTQALSRAKAPKEKQEALFYLGRIYQKLGNLQKAIEAFQECIHIKSQSIWAHMARRLLARVEQERGEYASSLRLLEALPSELRDQDFWIEMGRCHEKLGADSNAIAMYTKACADINAEAIQKKAILSLARIYRKKQAFHSAYNEYNTYLTQFPDDPIIPWILLTNLRLALEKLGYVEQGFVILQRFWQKFPENVQAAEAQYLYARFLERMERLDEAKPLYHRILRKFSGTVWADSAEEKLRKLASSNPSCGSLFMNALIPWIIHGSPDSSRTRLYWNLGLFTLDSAKCYREALYYLSQTKNRGWHTDSLYWALARTYDRLGNLENSLAFLDSSDNQLFLLKTQFPQSPFLVWGEKLLLLHRMKRDSSFLPSLIPEGMDSSFLFLIGTRAEKKKDFSLAISFFDRLQREFPNSLFIESVLFRNARCYYFLKELNKADSLFTLYLKQYPNGIYRPEVLWYKARLTQNTSEEAIAFLEEIESRFPFASIADSARRFLTDFYIHTRQKEKAFQILQKCLIVDSLRTLVDEMELGEPYFSQKKVILRKFAQLYLEKGEIRKAKNTVFQFMEETRDALDRSWAWTFLSQIAQASGNGEQAIFFLEQLASDFPSDTVLLQLGKYYTQQKKFENAISIFSETLKRTSLLDQKAEIHAELICAFLGADQIAQAETQLKGFDAEYKKLENYKALRGKIELERGRAFFKDKTFPFSEECFRNVMNKYSFLAPEAQLELARLYIVTNKTEKAMEILLEMVKKYSNHPIVSKVYLTLGDYYIQLNQPENAIPALKKALSDSVDKEVSATSSRYLIKIYDTLQMYDAGIALAKWYISKFPFAEDRFQKLIQIGLFYFELKEYPRAIAHFQRLLPLADPETETELQYWIGKSYFEMGQYEQAAYEFLKVKYQCAPTQLPWAATALYEAGLGYVRLQKYELAKKLFQKIVQTEGPTSDLGRIAQQKILELESKKNDSLL